MPPVGVLRHRPAVVPRSAESVFPLLEPLLPSVQKPIQYVGGELNSTQKPWESAEVRWALMYPTPTRSGCPTRACRILYEVLNERDWILAERTYSVWPDMEATMRRHGIPQFTVDNHRPVGAFDVFGLSFSTELGYTNMLTALDLAASRCTRSTAPTTTRSCWAGGHAAFNPEPVADFLDAAVLGDGEEIVLAISDVIREWKVRGPSRPVRSYAARRAALPARVVRRGLRPEVYDVDYLPDGRIKRVVPNASGVPWRVHKHTLMDLDAWPYPKKPLVPLAETVHERLLGGDLPWLHPWLPVLPGGHDHPSGARALDHHDRRHGRERHPRVRLRGGRSALASSADHTEIGEIAKGLADRYDGTTSPCRCRRRGVDAFNITLANEFSRNGRRSGLTFAPEGGSERMRKVINKMVTEEDLIRTVATAYSHGWRQVKLYFMCGLPTETDETLLEIATLAKKVIAKGREVSGRNDIRCTVSIGGFVPKPHTPFQWAAQLDHVTTDERLKKLRGRRPRGQEVRPGHRLPLPRRTPGHHRGPALPRRPPRRPGDRAGLRARAPASTAGASTSPTTAGRPPPRARWPGCRWTWTVHHPRARARRGAAQGPPRLRPGQGLALGGLAGRHRPDSDVEVEDCRWTPCYDCGVCPQMDTEIQIGPTGVKLLPLSVV